MEGKPVSYSRLETRHMPQPDESNTHGVMHGGRTLYHLDIACGMTATRHAGTRVVTVSVDRMDFKSPIYMGEVLLYKTSVNMVHRSSLEIGARIEAENMRTMETRHVGTAYLSFVALNENGRPTPVRPLLAETDEDRRRMADAARRSYLRRMERAQSKGKAFVFPIELMAGGFMLCRFSPGVTPPALPPGSFAAFAVTDTEATLIMPESALNDALLASLHGLDGARMEKGWRAFAVRADLDLTVSGVVANLSAILAAENISVQYVSTFSSGYLLVRGDAVDAATEALRFAGHLVACA